ncbi:hypothetical protein ACF1GS_29230 [Streptomyces eurythermus]|uniref:hypothetical protein n=1 Tax=Streptomyces eurythermus TaxID=42237 RepID=UPI0036F5E497
MVEELETRRPRAAARSWKLLPAELDNGPLKTLGWGFPAERLHTLLATTRQ